jgi:P4 family phage/plasmid primase-like protien
VNSARPSLPPQSSTAPVDTATFLELLYGDATGGDVVLWTSPDRRSYWHSSTDLAGAAQRATRLAPGGLHVYHSVALQDRTAALREAQALESKAASRTGRPPRLKSLSYVRGYNRTACALAGAWADIDILNPGAHAATDLPATLEAAVALAYQFPVSPTLIVDSGHGIYGWWLFPELWTFETPEERTDAQQFIRRFHLTLGEKARAHGWTLDPTSDLARVLRLVGTINHKQDPRPVQVLEWHPSRRYNPSDLEQYLLDTEARTWAGADVGEDGDFDPVPIAPIEQGCSWLRHCRDDAAHLVEPEWYAMLGIVGRCADGTDLAHRYSAPHPGYSRDETSQKLTHALEAAGPRSCSYIREKLSGEAHCNSCPSWGTIKSPINLAGLRMAMAPGTNGHQEHGDPHAGGGGNGRDHGDGPGNPRPLDGLAHTDIGNGAKFARANSPDVRYCHPWRGWMYWDGCRFVVDQHGHVPELAKRVVRDMYREARALVAEAEQLTTTDLVRAGQAGERAAAALKWAMQSAKVERISAMLKLAQGEPGLPVTPGELNTHSMMLTVENGDLDLRTGLLVPHDRERLSTKLAPVTYDPNAACPTWLAFLDRIMGKKAEVIAFLKRAIGYSLTGDTSEQVLFLLYGLGANGKSTLLEILRALLGDYGAQAEFSTFLEKKSDAVRNDLADLFGARFVAAVEVEGGRRLAEALVKTLTGSDAIKARFLFQEYFTFQPSFKLWLAANSKPVIRGQDHAIWRRIRLIPFEIQIPEAEQDRQLGQKLRAELPGILRWAVEGCLEWQEHGLGIPEEVRKATADYQAEMDVLGDFLAEHCITTDPQAYVAASALYSAYTRWCETANEVPLRHKAFGMRLSERGCRSDRTTTRPQVRIWRGIRLRTEQEHAPEGSVRS